MTTQNRRKFIKSHGWNHITQIAMGKIRLNTGHSGTLSTVHATSASQGLARFTSCVLQSGIELPYRAIKTNITDSLNLIIQLERRPGCRFVSEVLEIKGYDLERDRYEFNLIYSREALRR